MPLKQIFNEDLTQKQCTVCLEFKDKSEFYRVHSSHGRLRGECKKCINDYDLRNKEYRANRNKKYAETNPDIIKDQHLRRDHGITLIQYNEMLELQNHCCAGCKRHKSEFAKALSVDHDHRHCKSHKSCEECNRGLLCHNCNRALGHLRDDKDILQNLMNYLDSYNNK